MGNRKRLFSAFGGMIEVAHTDDNVNNGNDLVMETIQDCEPIIERAKMLSEMSPVKGEVFRHVGIMPFIEVNRAMREGWWNDMEAIKRWRNDPDNAAFKTWPGKI